MHETEDCQGIFVMLDQRVQLVRAQVEEIILTLIYEVTKLCGHYLVGLLQRSATFDEVVDTAIDRINFGVM